MEFGFILYSWFSELTWVMFDGFMINTDVSYEEYIAKLVTCICILSIYIYTFI